MTVRKIHDDDLRSIYDILGDVLAKKPGRPPAEFKAKVTNNRDFIGSILGIANDPPPTAAIGLPAAEAIAHKIIEEMPEPVSPDSTPEPEPVPEGDDSPAA